MRNLSDTIINFDQVIAGITSYKQSGGKIISGGARTGGGFFVRPTVIEFCSAESLTNLDPIGGPVICLYMVKNDEEAASIANEVIGNTIGATSYVAVFSNNLETISRFTKKSVLKSNIVLVNSLDDTPLRTMEVSISHLTYTNRKSVHIKSMIKGNKVKIPVSESDQQM
jgi:acyl-CoA reductase-like NAD-dependent aldehyde dehydrogenase